MNSRFLRDEAARFRSMAADTDHEASKLRRLATADEYEARAAAADAQTKPPAVDETPDVVTDPTPAQGEGEGDGEVIKRRVGSKLTLGLEAAAMGERRPVGRPRLKLPNP